MPIKKQYRCNNCGNRFSIEILTKEEVEDRKRKNQPTYSIHCPDCNRTDVRSGWE